MLFLSVLQLLRADSTVLGILFRNIFIFASSLMFSTNFYEKVCFQQLVFYRTCLVAQWFNIF